jgi:lipid II:glycine glycyltransferase (peptidoglycan interpeptide bridge formation enzyme)
MQEPQQTTLYAEYMKLLKWNVETIDGIQIFFRKFPFSQTLAKIHRPYDLPVKNKLRIFIKKHGIRYLVVEPVHNQPINPLKNWLHYVSRFTHIVTTPYLPTKTIHIPVLNNLEDMFRNFSEAKRRAVRRALKLGVTASESSNIDDLIRIKNKSAGLFGFITTTGIRELWSIFFPGHASIVLAHDSANHLLGGVLLLHWDHVSYYWIAGSTKAGKKVYAPTLLVWKSLQVSLAKKSKIFDFVGVWDERIPKENTQWLGFTKFKGGFGGKEIYYPLVSELKKTTTHSI